MNGSRGGVGLRVMWGYSGGATPKKFTRATRRGPNRVFGCAKMAIA